MSKDSSATNLHMHHPRLADYFEDFTRPYTSQNPTTTNTTSTSTSSSNYLHHHGPTTTTTTTNVTYGATGSNPTSIPSYLPIEDIYVLPQHQPPNPEDEDDVVPDQHAAFGISRAMEGRREVVWRDLGLEGLVRGRSFGRGGQGQGQGQGREERDWKVRRDVGLRVKGVGRLMGGRRTICLR